MEERTGSFGYWLRRRRKALDLTQEALAQSVACSRFAIRKIEADERRPSRRLAERLAEKLAIPPQERPAFLDAARSLRSAARLEVDHVPAESARSGESVPFVGRGNEYGLLLGLLAKLTAGSGHAVLVEGEPGIGKSRLLRELAGYAGTRGLSTLVTNCYEIEKAMPYQPVIDLVTQALDLAPAAVLHKLAPVSLAEIAALVPAVAQRASVPALSSDFPEARQARLFRAIGQLFEALVDGRQLVVMVDDVQWADDASVQFLHYFARQAASRPLLVVCAYRDEELAGHARLAEFASSLRREAHARHVPLTRLRLADTRELLAGLGKSELAERLHRETDGNPFFLTSMLHALEGEIAAEAGALPLPEALRASVRARLAHVPPQARPVLDVAAVLGRRFDFETLLAVTREPEETILGALDALVARRLLREEAEGFYDFSHDKVREVAYREIGGARRMLLHRAVAETLEGHGEGDAHLAEHYERGHVRHKALDHMLLAAERSQKLFALRDALHWLDRAVALAETHGEALQGRALVDLHERRGAVRAQAGQTAGAVEDIRRVIEAANARGDRAKARDALIQLGMTHRRADDYVQATACLTHALGECREMKDDRHAADTLYHLGTVSWSDCRNAEAIAYHQQAVDICERLGLADLVAVQAYHGRGETHYSNLEPRAAIACFDRSNQLARAIGDKSYESENLMMIAYAHTGYMGLADYAQAEAKFEAALDIAQRADLQWHMGPTVLGLHHVKACTGHYGEAWKGITEALRWLESVRHTRYQIIAHDYLAVLFMDLGMNREAVEQCERGLARAKEARVMFWRPRMEANLAIAKLRLGDLTVGPALEAALAYCRQHSERFQEMRCLDGLAELSLERADHARCLTLAAQMLSHADAAGAKEIAAQARRWRGQALMASRDEEGAARELGMAAQAAQDVGRIRLVYDIECARDRKAATAVAARIRASVAGTELENRALTPIPNA